MIKVLLVDDDSEVRARLRRLLTAAGDIAIIGEAANGRRALSMVDAFAPHVVLMDTEMPEMDGYETATRIMTKRATPVILVAPCYAEAHADKGFRAIEAGAVAVLALPWCRTEDCARLEKELVETVRAMSAVGVVRRRPPRNPRTPALAPARGPAQLRAAAAGPVDTAIDLIAIGASTGGPRALQTILAELPRDFGASVVVVQHISPEFQRSFIRWLSDVTGLPVEQATSMTPLRYGSIYVAPRQQHMGIDRCLRITLRDGPPENGAQPSVSYLFRSIARGAPRRTVAVLLTGMGRDGADGLLELRKRGALTVAQSEESAVVNSMPGEAVRLGAAEHVLAPADIGRLLADLTSDRPNAVAGQELGGA